MPNYGDKSVPKCSFCGKSEFMVDRLLYGSTAFICDECVNLCYQMLHEEDEYESKDKEEKRLERSGRNAPFKAGGNQGCSG